MWHKISEYTVKNKSLPHSCAPSPSVFLPDTSTAASLQCILLEIVFENHKCMCVLKNTVGILYTLSLTLFFSLKSVFWSLFSYQFCEGGEVFPLSSFGCSNHQIDRRQINRRKIIKFNYICIYEGSTKTWGLRTIEQLKLICPLKLSCWWRQGVCMCGLGLQRG